MQLWGYRTRRQLLKCLHEYLPDVLLVLVSVAIFATVRLIFRVDASQGASAGAVKETSEVAGSIVGTMLAVLAALAGYRRFLKGRVFATRARLSLTSRPLLWLEADGTLPRRLLHSVDVEVENVRDRTLWEPRISIQVRTLNGATCELEQSTDSIEAKLKSGGLEGVEPGEAVPYHYRFAVPAAINVFKITAELVVDGSDAWHRAMTIANELRARDDSDP
jgi:hypothetical protein